MRKLLLLALIMLPVLAGCAKQSDEEIAMQSEFNVTFDAIDKEAKTAEFTINGFANEEEFAQVETIITDSMDKQEVKGKYTVSVYSQVQKSEGEPTYGTVTYEDGELSDNNVKNITIEEYIALVNN